MVDLRILKSIARDDRGATGVVFALTLVPALVLAGGTMDFGRVLAEKVRIQAAADAASIAGARLEGATAAERTEEATKVFRANMKGENIEPEVIVDGDNVSVAHTAKVLTPFLNLVNIPELDASGFSKAFGKDAKSGTSAKACLLALDPNSDDGIHVQGTNRINYEGCWAHTNSNKPTGINGVGTARAKGDGHCAVGAHVAADQFDPLPTDGCSSVGDPFATVGAYETGTYAPTLVPPAKASTCTANKLNLKKGSFTLIPGRYCGGISLQAGASVTFNPGVYYIDDGDLLIQSGATAKGSDILFYLAGANAKFSLLGGGTIKLDGRKTGSSYEGFILIMDADANRFGESNIQGGGSFTINGMLYAPTQRIEVSGNGDVNTDSVDVFGMVAKDFYFRGNGVFNFRKHSGGDIPDLMTTLPTEVSRKTVIRQ